MRLFLGCGACRCDSIGVLVRLCPCFASFLDCPKTLSVCVWPMHRMLMHVWGDVHIVSPPGPAQLITYEALGLCEVGGAGRFIDAGDNTYGGKVVVNPSGGLVRGAER